MVTFKKKRMTHDHDNQIKVIVQKKEIWNDVNLCFTPCVDVLFCCLEHNHYKIYIFVWYYLLHKVQKILTFATFTLQRERVSCLCCLSVVLLHLLNLFSLSL